MWLLLKKRENAIRRELTGCGKCTRQRNWLNRCDERTQNPGHPSHLPPTTPLPPPPPPLPSLSIQPTTGGGRWQRGAGGCASRESARRAAGRLAAAPPAPVPQPLLQPPAHQPQPPRHPLPQPSHSQRSMLPLPPSPRSATQNSRHRWLPSLRTNYTRLYRLTPGFLNTAAPASGPLLSRTLLAWLSPNTMPAALSARTAPAPRSAAGPPAARAGCQCGPSPACR